jgi:hypothetical protein
MHRSVLAPRADAAPTLAVIVGWIAGVLAIDHRVGAAGQFVLGALTWLLLIVLARRESVEGRVQIGVVVVFASVIEYVFSPLLEVYTYRLGGVFGVPSFVPPGHGLVYLGALCVARIAWCQTHRRALIAATVVIGGAYAAWGLWWSPQPDALGAFWYLCLLGFLAWGRLPLLYVGAFGLVTALELIGTRWGVWKWASEDPTGWVSIGNPPSIAAGGYGWFDLAAVYLTPLLMAAWSRAQRVQPATRSADSTSV